MNEINVNKYASFEEQYEAEISNHLKEIHLFLKTKNPPFKTAQVAEILDISPAEVKKIMNTNNINNINGFTFYTIMREGSSYICKLFNRELTTGTPYIYSPKDVSYIYGISELEIIHICNKLNIKNITANNLHYIFKELRPVAMV